MTKTLIPRPNKTPVSLTDLYRSYTSDMETSGAQILRAFQSEPESRKQAVSLRLKGYSWPQIGAALGVSHGSAASRVDKSTRAVWKKVHGYGRGYKWGLIKDRPRKVKSGKTS